MHHLLIRSCLCVHSQGTALPWQHRRGCPCRTCSRREHPQHSTCEWKHLVDYFDLTIQCDSTWCAAWRPCTAPQLHTHQMSPVCNIFIGSVNQDETQPNHGYSHWIEEMHHRSRLCHRQHHLGLPLPRCKRWLPKSQTAASYRCPRVRSCQCGVSTQNMRRTKWPGVWNVNHA